MNAAAGEPKVLIVDDQPEVLDYLESLLKKKGYDVIRAPTASEAMDAFLQRDHDLGLVLLDLDLGPGQRDGLELLERMKAEGPLVPVVILTGKGNIDSAVRAMKLGAQDFLEKDIYMADFLEVSVDRARSLAEAVRRSLRLERENARLEQRARYYQNLERRKYGIVGSSPALLALLKEVDEVADIPRPVLLRGERGTGKELVAAALHYRSCRAEEPFVTLNCAAIAPGLMDSELFGHEKGAFTGAAERRIGRFEMADGGTLFLDEIGNMSVEFQQKILRVLEYGIFQRVQGTETIRVNVRVVAATNADIEELIRKGLFRADLYDRLAFRVLTVPPLRERIEDVPVLVERFTRSMYEEVPTLPTRHWSQAAIERLCRHDWPGNVSELRNVVERIACSPGGDVIQPEEAAAAGVAGVVTSGSFEERIEQLQRTLLAEAIQAAGGNQRQAARRLGLTYDQFRYYYRKYRSNE